MASGYHYRFGPWELDSSTSSTASTAIAAEDAVKISSGKTLPATAGAKIVGVSFETKLVGNAATNPVQMLVPTVNRTRYVASPKNSSNLVATDAWAQVDLFGTTGAMGFDRAVTTNGDFTLYRVLTTGTSGLAVVIVSDPGSLSST